MYFHYYFYQVAMVFSFIISLVVAIMAWRRRRFPGAPPMVALAAATFIWTLAFFIEAHCSTLEMQMFFGSHIAYIGLMAVPVAWFLFALRYTNIGGWLRGPKIGLLFIIPAITLILIWTNSWHHLMWSNVHQITTGAFVAVSKTYEPFFWVAASNNYILTIAGSVFLIRRLFVGTRLYMKQAVSLGVAALLPLLWNIIYVFDLFSLPRKDLTPVMFAISGMLIVLGLIRFRLLLTIPFTHRFIIQQMNEGVFVFDIRNRLVEINPAALKIIRADENVIGKDLGTLVPMSPLFEQLSPDKYGRTEQALRIAGEERSYEVETMPMLDYHVEKVGWLVILHDITARRRVEEEYKLIAERSADVIYKLAAKEGRYIYMSPSVERLLGYTEQEALSLTTRDVLTAESYQRQYAELAKGLQGRPHLRTLQLEAIHKDGHVIPIEVHANFIYNEQGEPAEIVGVARDVTERKRMEEQLIMQDRLASIGQLSAGIAHEINNPLTGIITFSALLLRKDLPEDIREDLETINSEAQRATRIIKDLLSFARQQPEEKQPTDVNECIRKVLELRAYEHEVNGIKVYPILDPELPRIMGNSSQLQQVFFDIVINAEFFMVEAHGRGVLTITTENTDGFVRATIADDGPGISKENLKHLFSPFFTTKEVGKGTGLGLSICLGIVNEHGGRIWAESENGQGASFIIELPVYEAPPEEETA